MNQQLQQAHCAPPPSRQEPATPEFTALARHLASAQRRCSDLISAQAQEIAELKAQAMRMRAVIVARESALAWAVQDRQALEQSIPGLAARATLTRQVKELRQRLQDLMRDTLQPSVGMPWSMRSLARMTPAPRQAAHVPFDKSASQPDDTPALSDLEASVAAADLVICQTGCLSHGAYWRVQDHCKRTGKTCMLVAQPATFRVVRIHQQAAREHDAAALMATAGAASKTE
jgi:hypothetical protein